MVSVPSSGPPSPRSSADDKVKDFLQTAKSAGTHTARQMVFANLLREVFGVQLGEMLPGVEKKVGSKIFGVRGSIDQLFQGSVIEVKTDFEAELSDGLGELKKYFQALQEAFPGQKFVGLITDLWTYQAFRPVVQSGVVTDVKPASKRVRVSELNGEDFILWIDSIVFAQAKLKPTADALNAKFGPGSPVFEHALDTLGSLWASVEGTKSAGLKLRLWKRAMEIVYGEAPGPKAFVADTYLSILVRLLVYLRLERGEQVTRSVVNQVLDGTYFVNRGLTNLIEEDFFAWILDKPALDRAVELGVGLGNTLRTFDMSLADEDLFKEIYQDIVALGSKHATGEYYTPRWLCEMTLRVALDHLSSQGDAPPRILDPACGSGSFLTAAVHWHIEQSAGQDGRKVLSRVLSCVQGIDVNPIAVTIARANYLIALGDLLKAGEDITVPVFVSDAVKLPKLNPTIYHGVSAYDLEADGEHVLIPRSVLKEANKRLKSLAILSDSVRAYSAQPGKIADKRKELRASFLRQVEGFLTSEEEAILELTLDTMTRLVDEGKDTIWPFVVSNMYAPLMLAEVGFDLVLGNPPWIVMRSIPNKAYQEFLKASVKEYKLGDPADTELYTQMEMATLFYVKASDLYLRDGGTIAFVMPISVLTGSRHHAGFNTFSRPPHRLLRVDSFEKVSRIFSLPPCVLTARKGEPPVFPAPRFRWRGSISSLRRNSSWTDVEKLISFEKVDYAPVSSPEGESIYKDLFGAGANIYPRQFWLIEGAGGQNLGISRRSPFVRTANEATRVGKKEWRDMKMEDRVEIEFVFATYLGKDILPFLTMGIRPVVLPVKQVGSGLQLMLEAELRAAGYPLTSQWVRQAQHLWVEHRTEKSIKNFPHVLDSLDFQGKLTRQDLNKRYVVLYNARGADACSVVVDRKSLPPVSLDGLSAASAGFVADCTTYFFETDSDNEAQYLAAILNAPSISLAVKPFQPRGLYGARDLGPRPLQLAIPKFNPSSPDHANLSALAKNCHRAASQLTFEKPGFRSRRRLVQSALSDQIREIDMIVKQARMNEQAVASPIRTPTIGG